MHVERTTAHGNSNIGLYAFATNTYCILGPEASNLQPLIEEILQVPVVITTIAGTGLAGVFCTGTDDKLLLPSIVFDHELAALKKAGITVETIDTLHTALGNNIAVNGHGALAGPMFSTKELDTIEEALGLPVKQYTIAGIEVIGSSIAVNNKGAVVHTDASPAELQMVQDTFGLEVLLPGTVNFGVPYVRSGIICNDKGFLIGDKSGGPEITNADEGLGFIEG